MGVTLNRKVQQVGATVNDLVTQSSSISKTELDGIFAISAAILEPYSNKPLRIRISSVDIDANGVAKVECSRVYDKTAAPVAAPRVRNAISEPALQATAVRPANTHTQAMDRP